MAVNHLESFASLPIIDQIFIFRLHGEARKEPLFELRLEPGKPAAFPEASKSCQFHSAREGGVKVNQTCLHGLQLDSDA